MIIKEFLEHPVFSQFDKIAKIPRQSGNEKEISDYLYNWAKERNLYVEQDSYNNVFIKKPASVGYENKSSIALQAHIDMVCEKDPDIDHDFKKDAIQYFIDDNIVSTRGRTTLGADDGMGVSYILAILNDTNLKHPAIEAIFTTDEEEGFSGARNFDGSKIKSDFLINLDHAREDEIVCASAGGIAIESSKLVKRIPLKPKYSPYRLSISGLKGGHSGEDIHKGNGNSIILLFRLLNSFINSFQILDINAGSFRLAIPRDASIDIAISDDNIQNIQKNIQDFKIKFIKEFPNYEDSLDISLEKINSDKEAILDEERDELIKLVLLYPNGIQEMSDVFENLVKTSTNLGEIYIEDEKLKIISEIRSLNESEIDLVLYKAETLSKLLNYDFVSSGLYHSWSYRDHSKLRDLAVQVFSENQKQNINTLAVHAGLECGFFLAKKPNLDIISIGPNCYNFHSPSEYFEIESAKKLYTSLIKLLENINF